MKFTTAAAASALAAVAAASPIAPATKGTNATVIPDGTPFMVTADAPGHIDLDYYYFQAQSRGIVTGAPTQTAACGPDPHNYAEFVLNNGTLNLYTANPPQSIYVDRSGMGRGLIQYTTGVQGLPRNAQRTTFAINDEGHLVYRDLNIDGDLNFIACRPVNGAKYSIWLGNGGNPADFEECIPIKARASISTEPVKCFYTNDQGIA